MDLLSIATFVLAAVTATSVVGVAVDGWRTRRHDRKEGERQRRHDLLTVASRELSVSIFRAAALIRSWRWIELIYDALPPVLTTPLGRPTWARQEAFMDALANTMAPLRALGPSFEEQRKLVVEEAMKLVEVRKYDTAALTRYLEVARPLQDAIDSELESTIGVERHSPAHRALRRRWWKPWSWSNRVVNPQLDQSVQRVAD